MEKKYFCIMVRHNGETAMRKIYEQQLKQLGIPKTNFAENFLKKLKDGVYK